MSETICVSKILLASINIQSRFIPLHQNRCLWSVIILIHHCFDHTELIMLHRWLMLRSSYCWGWLLALVLATRGDLATRCIISRGLFVHLNWIGCGYFKLSVTGRRFEICFWSRGELMLGFRFGGFFRKLIHLEEELISVFSLDFSFLIVSEQIVIFVIFMKYNFEHVLE